MSKKSSEQTRLNKDVKVLATLRRIEAYCKRTGHRPASVWKKKDKLTDIYMLLKLRRIHNIPTPPEIKEAMHRISQYPTVRKKAKQDNMNIIIARNSQLKQAKQIFPNVLLIKHLCGNDTYLKVIARLLDKKNADTTAMLVDYMDYAIAQATRSERVGEILAKYTGNNITAQDIAIIQNARATHNPAPRLAARTENLLAVSSLYGLRPAELALLYNRKQVTINSALARLRKTIVSQTVATKVIDAYLAGDADRMQALMPAQLRKIHAYQQATKTVGISTAQMNMAGQWLLNNFCSKSL